MVIRVLVVIFCSYFISSFACSSEIFNCNNILQTTYKKIELYVDDAMYELLDEPAGVVLIDYNINECKIVTELSGYDAPMPLKYWACFVTGVAAVLSDTDTTASTKKEGDMFFEAVIVEVLPGKCQVLPAGCPTLSGGYLAVSSNRAL